MGKYITFDGCSGTGKGKVIASLTNRLIAHGVKKIAIVRDNQLDTLRVYGVPLVEWCRNNSVDHRLFLFSLFAAGYQISDPKVAVALTNNDVILRDRSFISCLAYRTESDVFSPAEVWDLYVNYAKLRIPDCAVIVDAEVSVQMERLVARSHNHDVGLGGKMSDDAFSRERLRQRFLELPDCFKEKCNMFTVSNNHPYTDDITTLECNVAETSEQIFQHLIKTGVIV